jgi:hypothetical protein
MIKAKDPFSISSTEREKWKRELSLYPVAWGVGSGRSSVRSAMSIANIVLAPFELHQERHEEEGCIHRLGRALNPAHAAPNGAVLLPSSTENSEQPT